MDGWMDRLMCNPPPFSHPLFAEATSHRHRSSPSIPVWPLSQNELQPSQKWNKNVLITCEVGRIFRMLKKGDLTILLTIMYMNIKMLSHTVNFCSGRCKWQNSLAKPPCTEISVSWVSNPSIHPSIIEIQATAIGWGWGCLAASKQLQFKPSKITCFCSLQSFSRFCALVQMLLFPGQPPSQSGRYAVSMSGELTITDVHAEDSGFYICQAISVAGSVMSKVLLDVEGGEMLGPTVF